MSDYTKERNKEIIEKWKAGMKQRDIAMLYNLSQQRISQIINDELEEDVPHIIQGWII